MATTLELKFTNYKTGKWINWRQFEPFGQAFFDGVCLPLPGDIIYTNDDSHKKYEVVRREFENINNSDRKCTLMNVFLKRLDNLEEL